MKKFTHWQMAIFVLIVVSGLGTARPAWHWWQARERAAWAADCRLARRERRWNDLQRIAAHWSEKDPRTADPWLFLAEAAQGRQDWSAVAAALRQIPETDAKAASALVELAQLEFGPLNQPLQGEKTCQNLLRLEQRAVFAHERLIQFYAATLQREKLMRQIRTAIELRCEPPEAYVYLLLLDTLRMDKGVEFNEHWLQAHPGDELFEVARAIQIPEPTEAKAGLRPDQLDAARALSAGKRSEISTLFAKYPENLELLAYEIDHQVTQGEIDSVVELLSRAPESAERDSRFWRFKGWVHETRDELAEAETAYRKALELHALDWNTWNRLANIARRRNEPDAVLRMTAIVDQSKSLRTKIRELPAAELVTPEILSELASYARKCNVNWLADALDRRLKGITPQ